MRLLSGEEPVDLSLANRATLYMGNRNGLKVQGNMSIYNQSIESNHGIVEYQWQTGDTDTVGDFQAEIEVEWPDGGLQTFPAASYIRIRVYKDLG
jgi:hypothetical protein